MFESRPDSPKKAFVIGDPIAHSRSPLLHRSWLSKYDIEGTYEPIHVTPSALAGFVDRLHHAEFVGGNVTIPHKQAIMPFCTRLSDSAKRIGAVNTLVVKDNEIFGHNTDWIGFARNLDAEAPGWDRFTQRSAIVLGAGGAARAILLALMERGFSHIVILNRTAEKARDLAAEFSQSASVHLVGGGLHEFGTHAPNAKIVVNTSSVGMNGTKFEGLAMEKLPADALVTDIVYTPLETPLLAAARALGLETVDGLGMLIHQAVPGFAAWFGLEPQVTPQLRARLEQSLFTPDKEPR